MEVEMVIMIPLPLPFPFILFFAICDHHLYIAFFYNNLSVLGLDSHKISEQFHFTSYSMGWFWTDNPGRSSARVAPHPIPKDGATPPVCSTDTIFMLACTDNMAA